LKKKGSCSKKTRYWGHLPYMCKSKSGRSLLGVEHKPKRIKEAHSGTRECYRDLNWIPMKEYINEKLV